MASDEWRARRPFWRLRNGWEKRDSFETRLNARDDGKAEASSRTPRGASQHNAPLPPGFFVSADSKEVIDEDLASADSKGVARGRFRLISAKTRRSSVSADSKGVMGAKVEWFKGRKFKERFGMTHPAFLQRGRNGLKRKRMRFALLQGSAKSAPFAAQGRKERGVRDWAWGS
jgi:hypothetical protein